MRNLSHIKCFIVSSFILFLVACSSAPPEVTASRNLIPEENKYPFTQKVPTELVNKIQQQAIGSEFDYKGIQVTLLDNYTSALGLFCRNVKLTPVNTTIINEQQHRVVCQFANQDWFIIPHVIQNTYKPIAFDS